MSASIANFTSAPSKTPYSAYTSGRWSLNYNGKAVSGGYQFETLKNGNTRLTGLHNAYDETLSYEDRALIFEYVTGKILQKTNNVTEDANLYSYGSPFARLDASIPITELATFDNYRVSMNADKKCYTQKWSLTYDGMLITGSYQWDDVNGKTIIDDIVVDRKTEMPDEMYMDILEYVEGVFFN